MANTCMIYRHGAPATWYSVADWQTGTAKYWANSGGTVPPMYGNPAHFALQAQAAISNGSPFYFDADVYGIKCVAFPTGGDSTSIFGLNQAIAQLQASMTSVQTDVNTLKTQVGPVAAASQAASSGGLMTTDLQVEYFGAVLAFLAVVWLADRVRRYFWRDGGDHV